MCELTYTKLEKEKQNSQKKIPDRLMVTRSGRFGEDELDKSHQKIQTSSHQINKYEVCDGQYDDYS